MKDGVHGLCSHTVEIENITVQNQLDLLPRGLFLDVTQESFKSIIKEKLTSFKLFP